MKRPLVVSAAALIWGIVLSDVNNSYGWGLACVALSIVAMILLYRPKKADASRFILLAIPFLLTGYFIHNLNITHHSEVFKPWDGQASVASGRVYDEPVFSEGKTSFILDVRTIENGKESSKISKGYIKVNIYSEAPISDIQYGSVVKLS
jgi:hypothetical protein